MNIEKRRQFIINFIYCFIIGAIIYILLKYGVSLIFPFLFAFFVAFILKGPISFLSRKLRLKRSFVAVILVILFYAIIITIFSLIGIKAFAAVRNFIFRLPSLYTSDIQPYLLQLFKSIETYASKLNPSLMSVLNDYSSNLLHSLGEQISTFSVTMVTSISGYAYSLPVFLVKLLFAVIASFFITVDYDNIVNFILRQLSEKHRRLVLDVKVHLFQTLFGYGRSYALIMLITFLEVFIGLSIIGVNRAFYIAALTAVLDILPVLGTGSVMIPWAAVSLFFGNYPLAIKLFVLYLIITVIRNIIEPKIVGDQVGLPPVVTLLAMFVGTQLFGIIGLFGLPITLSLLRNMDKEGLIHIFK